MRILAPRLREEVWAALPEGVEVRFLDEPWPKACDLFIPPYGQEEVVRRVLEEVEVKVVQTLSAGVDWILPLVPEGVVLCDGSGIHDAPVAEWVVLALLALLKDLPGFLEAQKEGRWAPRRLSDLEGKRVLLLGYGSIGKAVAERLRPFGVALFPVARHPRPGVYTQEDLPAHGVLRVPPVCAALVAQRHHYGQVATRGAAQRRRRVLERQADRKSVV